MELENEFMQGVQPDSVCTIGFYEHGVVLDGRTKGGKHVRVLAPEFRDLTPVAGELAIGRFIHDFLKMEREEKI